MRILEGEIIMNIKIVGKELKATDAIKDYIGRKSEKLAKYFGDEFEVTATIKTEGGMQVAEMEVRNQSDRFRAVTEHRDLYASIDKDIDILEGQVRKMKTKKDQQNMTESIRNKEIIREVEKQPVEGEIVKTVYYEIKPLAPEDAKLKLEERPQDRFLTFINVETGKVSVIYRLKDNKNYGLIEPEA